MQNLECIPWSALLIYDCNFIQCRKNLNFSQTTVILRYFVPNWYASTWGFSAPVTEVIVARWIYELNNKHLVLEDYITSSIWSHYRSTKMVAYVFHSVFTIIKSHMRWLFYNSILLQQISGNQSRWVYLEKPEQIKPLKTSHAKWETSFILPEAIYLTSCYLSTL